MLQYLLQISLLIWIENVDSDSISITQRSHTKQFHIASTQEIQDRQSELLYLGEEYINQNGQKLHITVYEVDDELTAKSWVNIICIIFLVYNIQIYSVKILQRQLHTCLYGQTLSTHTVDQSFLFQPSTYSEYQHDQHDQDLYPSYRMLIYILPISHSFHFI